MSSFKLISRENGIMKWHSTNIMDDLRTRHSIEIWDENGLKEELEHWFELPKPACLKLYNKFRIRGKREPQVKKGAIENKISNALRIRFTVLTRDGFACKICGRTALDGVKLEVDHRMPKSKGGTDHIENLWTLCFDCNRGKRDKIIPILLPKELQLEKQSL